MHSAMSLPRIEVAACRTEKAATQADAWGTQTILTTVRDYARTLIESAFSTLHSKNFLPLTETHFAFAVCW